MGNFQISFWEKKTWDKLSVNSIQFGCKEEYTSKTEWNLIKYFQVILLSNVLVEFDKYRGINVLAGSSRSVITVDPEMWEARHLRHHAQTATLSSQDRLRTFVAGNLFTAAAYRPITITQLVDLGLRGATSEAEALRFVSVMGSVTGTTLLDNDSVIQICKNCGDEVTSFFEDLYDCGNFSCQGVGQDPDALQAAFNVKVSIKDEAGELSDLQITGSFLLEILGEAAAWPNLPEGVRKTTANLFLQGFVRFFLAVELPLTSQARPMRMMIVSAE